MHFDPYWTKREIFVFWYKLSLSSVLINEVLLKYKHITAMYSEMKLKNWLTKMSKRRTAKLETVTSTAQLKHIGLQ